MWVQPARAGQGGKEGPKTRIGVAMKLRKIFDDIELPALAARELTPIIAAWAGSVANPATNSTAMPKRTMLRIVVTGRAGIKIALRRFFF